MGSNCCSLLITFAKCLDLDWDGQNVGHDLDLNSLILLKYSKTCLKRPLSKRPKIVFQDHLSLNAGQSIAECSKGSIL